MKEMLFRSLVVASVLLLLSGCAGMTGKQDYLLPKESKIGAIIDIVESQRTALITPYRSFDKLSEELGIREFKATFCSSLSARELESKLKKLCSESKGNFSYKACWVPNAIFHADIRRNGRCDYSYKYAILALENIDAPYKMWIRKVEEQKKRNWLRDMM